MKSLPFDNGKTMSLKEKPAYEKARVEQSRLNGGGDQNWCGTRSMGKMKGSSGKKMGKAY